ncbi:MAG: RNA polymerase sigma factor [Bacteroidales bacterium]
MVSNFIYISDKKYAFKLLFNDFYAGQVMFAKKIIGNRQDAEDIVQEVFLNIWKSKKSFSNEISFKAYLYLSTRNKCIDYIRKDKHLMKELSVADLMSTDEMDQIIKTEAFTLLYKAIEKLPPQTKKVILQSMKGHTVQEVADILKVSVNTVKTLKQKAYRMLRDIYGDAFVLLLYPFLFN